MTDSPRPDFPTLERYTAQLLEQGVPPSELRAIERAIIAAGPLNAREQPIRKAFDVALAALQDYASARRRA